MVEGRWLSSNQVPTSEDYLRNGVITSGAPLMFLHIFFMLGHDLRETDVNHITSVVACPAKIMRLRDDMGSAKDEAQEGLDGSYKELYLRENPHGNAEEHMLKMPLPFIQWERVES
jgi:(3S)-linalool synthase